MEETQNAAHFMTMIDMASSYHELAVFRSRYFSLIERTLTKEACRLVKDHWNKKAKDPKLPIAPAAAAPKPGA